MKLRAVIFDIYKTVLEVGPPPLDREEKWRALTRERLGAPSRLTLAEFTTAYEAVIAREHVVARKAGVPYPEIHWPDVAAEVLPELGTLTASERADFLFRQQALFRTVRLMPGAAETLRAVRGAGLAMGIASNAQPYTLREAEGVFAGEGLALDMFTRPLCFWSFEHGFSKPDPHVFRLLTARLRLAGMQPAEALMVGDRFDNDIAPAHAQGWRTWQLSTTPRAESGGDWRALSEFIAAHI